LNDFGKQQNHDHDMKLHIQETLNEIDDSIRMLEFARGAILTLLGTGTETTTAAACPARTPNTARETRALPGNQDTPALHKRRRRGGGPGSLGNIIDAVRLLAEPFESGVISKAVRCEDIQAQRWMNRAAKHGWIVKLGHRQWKRTGNYPPPLTNTEETLAAIHQRIGVKSADED